MYKHLADKLRTAAQSLVADYADTQQFVYTNPGLHQVSDISYDLLHGVPGQRQSDPSSRKRDEEKKYDTLRIGPGPTEVDVLVPHEPPTMVSPGVPEPPKTDEQGEVKDTTKARGEPMQDSLDRDTYRSEGPYDSQEFV